MIKTAFTFNGSVEVRLIPANEDDKRLIDLTFNGREVHAIKPSSDGGIVLELVESKPKAKPELH